MEQVQTPSHNADCEATAARKQRLLEGRIPALESGWEVVHGNRRKRGLEGRWFTDPKSPAAEAGSDEAAELGQNIGLITAKQGTQALLSISE